MPFQKIDDGYVQVIKNTYKRNSFIVVQLAKPKFKTVKDSEY